MTDITATLGRKTRDGYLAATARTHTIGDQAPYFSVTGELWDSEGWYKRGEPDGRMRSCGCLHEEIGAAFPQLRPIIALHLSDAETGAPMHAVANGWYFYQGGDHAAAARALRVTEDELPLAATEDTFRAYAETLCPRWAREAAEGRALIETLA